MAPSPQKASWRRIDIALIPSDVGAGGERSASGQQSSPLAGQDVSSTPDYSLSPSTTLQTSSSPSIVISPSSLFPSPTSPSTTSTPPPPTTGFATFSQPLSDALSPTNTRSIFSSFGKPTFTVSSLGPSSFVVTNPLASSGSQPAVITKPFAAPVSFDAIVPSSPVVQSTHKVVDATLPASTPFPARIDGDPSLTSTSQIGPSPPVSFGGDAPANSADSDVLDVISPVIPTRTGGNPQGITAPTIGGFVDTSVPNGQTIGPVPLTSALPPGEIGISTITAPTTTSIASIPTSIISGVSRVDLFAHHRHDNDDDDDDRFKTTSSFTKTNEVVSYSLTEISGTQTSIPITETTKVVLPTVVSVHSHRSPNRSVPVAVIAAPILSVTVIIALVLAVLRRRWRLQHQRTTQARIQRPTFVAFSQVREMHQGSVLRSREGPPSLPPLQPLQSTVGWNDRSSGASTFGEQAHWQDPFAPTPPMIFRPLPDGSPPSDRPLSIRTIRRVPVPDPFLGSSGRTSTLGSPTEGSNRLSQTSSHDEHPQAPNKVGWAV